jgi:hypothetical protein
MGMIPFSIFYLKNQEFFKKEIKMVLNNIHVIIVCVNYCDFLKYTYKNNIKFFNKNNYYIITDRSDDETINYCKFQDHDQIRYFDFFKNAEINKSGAIYMMQKELHEKYQNDWILLLDADIMLPPNFDELFIKNCTNKDALYSFKRKNYLTKKDFELQQNLKDFTGINFVGFMQLYFDKTKYYAEYSKDCSTCDIFFRDKFYHTLTFIDENVYVIHLGVDCVNVKGRKSERW